MNTVIILKGIPGSGKSTWARQYKKDQEAAREQWRNDGGDPRVCAIVSADDYHMKEGTYRYDISKAGDAHAECMRNFMTELSYIPALGNVLDRFPHTVIVDNTNTSETEVYPYYLVAKAFGYDVELVTFLIDADISSANNVHSVPFAVCQAMHNKLMSSKVPPYWNIKRSIVIDKRRVYTEALRTVGNPEYLARNTDAGIAAAIRGLTDIIHQQFRP